jgi:hypothetical protein
LTESYLTFLPEDILDGSYAIGFLAIYVPNDFMKIGLVLRVERTPFLYQEAQEGQELLAGNVT